MGVCNCSMFCCTLLYVHSSIAIILMGKRELFALLNLSSWCLVMVERLFLAVPRGCLQFVIVVFPDHTDLLFCMVSIATNQVCSYVRSMPPSFASIPELNTCVQHILSWIFFPLPLFQEKQACCQLMAKQNDSLIAKKKTSSGRLT